MCITSRYLAAGRECETINDENTCGHLHKKLKAAYKCYLRHYQLESSTREVVAVDRGTPFLRRLTPEEREYVFMNSPKWQKENSK